MSVCFEHGTSSVSSRGDLGHQTGVGGGGEAECISCCHSFYKRQSDSDVRGDYRAQSLPGWSRREWIASNLECADPGEWGRNDLEYWPVAPGKWAWAWLRVRGDD